MDVQTLGIRCFLKHFNDERLMALYAHTQDHKLSYNSCCCLVGSLTADHPLKERQGSFCGLVARDVCHYFKAHNYQFSHKAEREFCNLGLTDIERCERLLPILQDEINLRESKKDVKRAIAETGVSA